MATGILVHPRPAIPPPPRPARSVLGSASGLGRWLGRRCQRAIRNRVLPGEIRAQAGLSRGERMLAAGYGPDGGYALIATNRALHHRDRGEGWSRLGWEQVAAVSWDAAARCIVIAGLDGIAPPRRVLRLSERGALPELAGERITHTQLGLWAVLLGADRRVLVEVRRRPVTDELVWAAADGGRDLGGPDIAEAVRKRIDDAVARLGEHLGVGRSGTGARGLPSAPT